ncbi:MAG TPA: DEAD/DEAH box helicase family protein [Cytophagaceae bacterium]
MEITVTRIDGGLHINPAPPYLLKYLKYQHRSMEIIKFKKTVTYNERLLYIVDPDGGIYTLQGFFQKICELIHKNKDTYKVVDLRTPLPEIDWEAVKAVGPRDYQVDPIIEALTQAREHSGIVNAAGGWGKTFAQALFYAAFNSLNTILAIPLKQVFNQTYEKFVKIFPNKHIGRVGGGYYDISQDITITTFKSLPKCAIEKCQLLLVDELQASTGDTVQETLTAIRPIRCFGFSATDGGMFNGADKVIKGLFGERLIHIPYDEALNVGAVVPGVVYMIKTPDMLLTASDPDVVLAKGIKKNVARNKLIAKACTMVPEGWATLTFVDHVQDHLIELYKLMPHGTKYLHRNSNKKELGDFALTSKQQDVIANAFANNEFQHLIATDAFRAGVDIPHVRVVIQASGGSSYVEVIQEALRGSRVLTEERRQELGVEPKTHFVLLDFQDNHHEFLASQAQKRAMLYRREGWDVRYVNSLSEIDWYDYKPKT